MTEVSFEEVIDTFDANHSCGETDGYSRQELLAAGEQFGAWHSVCITDPGVVRGVHLPNHLHFEERHDPRLVPATLTVGEAAQRLRSLLPDYAATHPRCWASLQYHVANDITPVYLTSGEPLRRDKYPGVQFGQQSLFHLDGLHRLLSLEYPEALTACYLGRESVKAFVGSTAI